MLRVFTPPFAARHYGLFILGLAWACIACLSATSPESLDCNGLADVCPTRLQRASPSTLAIDLPAAQRTSSATESDESVLSIDPRLAARREQHFAQLGVKRWHEEGVRGQGVKVAILDSGFRNYRDFLGRSLPAKVKVRSFRVDGNLEAKDSQHGIHCGEVVHAIAPEAELLFANWESDQPESFLKAVRWARQQGAQVISCSVITPSWSDGEGGGPVHESLAQILGTGKEKDDVLLFASAGNTAQRHWSGIFKDAGDGFHEWQPRQLDNDLSPWGGERVSVEVFWKAGASYDLFVYDRTAGTEVGRCTAAERGDRTCSVVRFHPVTGHRYQARVRLSSGTPGKFHLVALASGLRYFTANGSVAFPGDGPAVVAVGAVDSAGRRFSYSSCGPNSSAPKPDFVAPVPFPVAARTRPFGGTSAAAPQAAAAAALLWTRHPDWSAQQVREKLRLSAYKPTAANHCPELGYGLVKMP